MGPDPIPSSTPRVTTQITCVEVINACDKAIAEQTKVIQKQDEAIQSSDKAINKLLETNTQLQQDIDQANKDKNSIWRNPFVNMLIGLVAGVLLIAAVK